MSPIIEMILFYLLLLDAVTANVIAFLGEKWYIRHFRFFARYFPLTKGWTIYYLVLILLIGAILMNHGVDLW